MFNLRNPTTLRFCVVAVFLLVPPTSAAVPANDDHLALRGEAAALPGDWERRGATSDGAACSFNVVAPHGTGCVASCDRARDDCLIACDGSWWCVLCL